ncbi:hypothetical protein N0V83_010853 [Neocucurbitaria cava]|uniref:C2H2-type domain-containing protein n=1 Tax=Neocucurbitaria cava TaxID=798079 RepID=A0A9W8XZJ1_9PLEO|nr:hypothetical protein N0V83_010853 [Neocucurbitaria cava]
MDPTRDWSDAFSLEVSEYELDPEDQEESSSLSHRNASTASSLVETQGLNIGLIRPPTIFANGQPNLSTFDVPVPDYNSHVPPNNPDYFRQQPQGYSVQCSQGNIQSDIYGYRASGVFYTVPVAPQQHGQASTGHDPVSAWDHNQSPWHPGVYPPTEMQGYSILDQPSAPKPQMPYVPYSSPQQSEPKSVIPNTSSDELLAPENDTDILIGSVFRDGKLKCCFPDCFDKSFGRQAELRRHYDTSHAVYKPEFWCPVTTCGRSALFGRKPFPRKDKLMDHVESMHGDA